jgi:hypothetical protein
MAFARLCLYKLLGSKNGPRMTWTALTHMVSPIEDPTTPITRHQLQGPDSLLTIPCLTLPKHTERA